MNRYLSLTGLVALAALLMVLGPSASFAEEFPAVEVSETGTVYSQEFEGLFDGTVLVPRAIDSESFTVSNASERDVYLRIVLTEVRGSSPLYLASLGLMVTGPTWSSEPLLLSNAAPCREVTTGIPLQRGETMNLGVDVSLADLDGTQAQQETARFSLQLVATEHIDRPGPNTCAATPPGTAPTPPTLAPKPPQLGDTGSRSIVTGLIAGAALIGSGATILARYRISRRRGTQ